MGVAADHDRIPRRCRRWLAVGLVVGLVGRRRVSVDLEAVARKKKRCRLAVADLDVRGALRCGGALCRLDAVEM